MSADLLRRAATTLRDPYRNTTAWDLPLADWLDLAAYWYAGAPHSDEAEHALAVARAVLREPEGGDRT